ncbi:hypothetical protein VTJ04DRAFT_10473 [Mycothermus thermophilus]|uniref:uncharacterized protein n=1 Tax=Humicola insolens TaxID=85995 RepID=UPI003744A846
MAGLPRRCRWCGRRSYGEAISSPSSPPICYRCKQTHLRHKRGTWGAAHVSHSGTLPVSETLGNGNFPPAFQPSEASCVSTPSTDEQGDDVPQPSPEIQTPPTEMEDEAVEMLHQLLLKLCLMDDEPQASSRASARPVCEKSDPAPIDDSSQSVVKAPRIPYPDISLGRAVVATYILYALQESYGSALEESLRWMSKPSTRNTELIPRSKTFLKSSGLLSFLLNTSRRRSGSPKRQGFTRRELHLVRNSPLSLGSVLFQRKHINNGACHGRSRPWANTRKAVPWA